MATHLWKKNIGGGCIGIKQKIISEILARVCPEPAVSEHFIYHTRGLIHEYVFLRVVIWRLSHSLMVRSGRDRPELLALRKQEHSPCCHQQQKGTAALDPPCYLATPRHT